MKANCRNNELSLGYRLSQNKIAHRLTFLSFIPIATMLSSRHILQCLDSLQPIFPQARKMSIPCFINLMSGMVERYRTHCILVTLTTHHPTFCLWSGETEFFSSNSSPPAKFPPSCDSLRTSSLDHRRTSHVYRLLINRTQSIPELRL